MRHSTLTFLLLLSLVPVATLSGAQVSASERQVAVKGGVGAPEPVLDAIDRHFHHFQLEANVPGLVWGVVQDGRLVHLGTSGVQDLTTRREVTVDSLFRIASMSKAFTALAILKLRDEGRLSLDALAEDYVPEMRGWRYPTADSPRIRVRDLLSHTAGFVTDDPWGDRQSSMQEAEFTRILTEGVPFNRVPGTAHEYSNFGYAVLGRVVSNVSGRPYKDHIEREIMWPLGMNSSGYDIAEATTERRAIGYRWHGGAHLVEADIGHGAFGAMGGIQTSARDYARYVAWMLSAWPPRDDPETGPVQRASVREMAQGLNFASARKRPGETDKPCWQGVAYGMGMRVHSDCDLGTVLTHGGGFPGYGSYLLMLPDRGVGIFAFANGTYAAPVSASWRSAMELQRSSRLPPRAVRRSDPLSRAYGAVGEMYRLESLAPVGELVAMNFFLDRGLDERTKELSELKKTAGECDVEMPLNARGNLTGSFTWSCERGQIQGEIVLAPTPALGIQALRFARAD